MAASGGKGSSGEMRRRHEAIIRSGALGRIGSEGRLVFALALCWADYRTCAFRMSARGAATVSGVQPTAIRRGLSQLVDQGIIQAGQKEQGKRRKYRFLPPQEGAHEVCAPPDTQCAHPAHEACAPRARSVSGARTTRVPYSSIVLKGSSRTLDGSCRTGPAGPAGPEAAGDGSQEGAA